jgi:hypothetical protein
MPSLLGSVLRMHGQGLLGGSNMRDKTVKNIVIGGITAALIFISLYLGTIINNNRIFFLALSTYFESIPFINSNIRSGILVYFASSLLAVMLLSNKIFAVSYIIFGIYPLIKLVSEKRRIITEILLKYSWLNLSVIISYFIYTSIFKVQANTHVWLFALIMLEIGFAIYDIIFSKFIYLIREKIIKKI